MTCPAVSVVIPTRNRSQHLERAARSVLSQSYGSIEVVVVDDASTDATGDVLTRLTQDTRVVVVRNPTPLGECGARNRGLAEATGEFVAFCDDDDMWLPEAAQELIRYLERNPDIGAVTAWHRVYHDSSGRAVDFRGPLHFDAQELLWQNLAIVFGMFRRSAFADGISFDEGFVTGGDWDLWLRTARQATLAVLPEVLYLYRQHGGGQATTALERQAQGRRRLLDKHGSDMSPACRLYHETILSGYSRGRAGMRHRLGQGWRASRQDTAYVAAVLGTSFLASKVGTRRRDPGLQARLMGRLVHHDPSAARGKERRDRRIGAVGG